MKNRRLAYKSQNFETSVSETGVWEETRSSAFSEKCTAEVNLSPSPNNCGKTGMVTPSFIPRIERKCHPPWYIQLWRFFHSLMFKYFFSNNCCDVMLGVLSERGSTDRRAYYSPLWCFWKRLNGLPQHCCGIIRTKHSFRIHWLLSGNSGYFTL